MFEEDDIYNLYDYVIDEIEKCNNINNEYILHINEREKYDKGNIEYFINRILEIENNLGSLDIKKRGIVLRNCTRCIYWTNGGEQTYKRLILKEKYNKKTQVNKRSYKEKVYNGKTYYYIKESNNQIKEEFFKSNEIDDNYKNEYKLNDGKINNYSLNHSDMISTANNIIGEIYSDNVVFNSNMGHGYAAEKANDLYDKITGKDAKIIGSDLKKNGADRLVDGVQIQTKYCASGSKCISECFEGGEFRYRNIDGTPMKIEVPSDKYDDAVRAMENRIRRGDVPGVTDISEARNIVRKGKFTYEQAKNIAKFGRVESLTYDAINGIRVMGTAFGVSSIITFACSLWNGEDINTAFNQSLQEGMRIGGISWFSSVITAQIGRTGVEAGLRPFTDYLVKNIDKNTLSNLVNGLKGGSTPIYGAAAVNNLSKTLRGNILTSTVSTAVLSFVDVNRLVKGEISGKQAFKNITTTASSVAGGGAGSLGGAALGAMIGSAVPVIGTAVGGAIGGVLGGISGSSIVSKAVKDGLDNFIEDDAKEMMDILSKQLEIISFNYLLNKNEIIEVINELSKKNISEILRIMYSSAKREKYAYDIIEKLVIEIVNKRKLIQMQLN